MLLSYHYNFLFIHIPKTGGSSVRKAISALRWRDPENWAIFLSGRFSNLSSGRIPTKVPRHARIVAVKEMLTAELFESLFKFGFVRNPWDLQVSSWHHLRREKPHVVEKVPDFTTFLRWKYDLTANFPELPERTMLNRNPTAFLDTQSDYLKDLSGRIVADYVGRYENLQEDFEHVCRTIGITPKPLPHVRQSKDRSEYRKYYTDETAELVATYFRSDIEQFGYTFD